MRLSVIIVNYNVRYFLEQCLLSVQNALIGISSEIIVVDNNSADDSVRMVEEHFPEAVLIKNTTNYGFSYANNQAIRLAQGEFVLLLNPDTLVEEKTFSVAIDFMQKHPEAGALGVKMIDGEGKYLQESKRSLPTPVTAFYKMFGLTRLFPHSKRFAPYYLGHLSENEDHEIEILAGAFMFVRKSTFDEVGLLDESFFMYGEDIDLSYRIIKEGYKNYYCSQTKIIHYKGESTKRGSLNYVIIFYKAMLIFAKKHFSPKQFFLYSFVIKIAIYFRAILSVSKHFFSTSILPITDFLVIYGGLYLLANYWQELRYTSLYYPDIYFYRILPFYAAVWVFSLFFTKAYFFISKINDLIKGVLLGSLFILVGYALINEDFRYSRIVIVLGTIWTFVYVLSSRWLLHILNTPFKIDRYRQKKIAIIASIENAEHILSTLKNSELKFDFIGVISPKSSYSDDYIGEYERLTEIVRIQEIDEIVFCSKDLTVEQIIDKMLELSKSKINYRIALPQAFTIIGKHHIFSEDDLLLLNNHSIMTLQSRILKRSLDILVAICFLFTFPFLFFVFPKKDQFFRQIIHVIVGKKTWVSVDKSLNFDFSFLSKLKEGIFTPSILLETTDEKIKKDKNIVYLKNYDIFMDIIIIFRGIKKKQKIRKTKYNG